MHRLLQLVNVSLAAKTRRGRGPSS